MFTGVFYKQVLPFVVQLLCWNWVIMSDTVPLLILKPWKRKFFEQELAMRMIVGEILLPKDMCCPTDCNGVTFLNLRIPQFSIKMWIFHFPEDFNDRRWSVLPVLFSKAIQCKPSESIIRSSLFCCLPGSYWSNQSTSKTCWHWPGQAGLLNQSKFLY